jgi:hypothetical protein
MLLITLLLVLVLQSSVAPQEPIRIPPTQRSTAAPPLREVRKGESAIEGLLQRVECPRGRPVRFTMRVGKKVERFEAARLEDVEYIAHTPDFKGPMTCGGRGKGDRVRLTWTSAAALKNTTLAEDENTRRVVAVEFLPRGRF